MFGSCCPLPTLPAFVGVAVAGFPLAGLFVGLLGIIHGRLFTERGGVFPPEEDTDGRFDGGRLVLVWEELHGFGMAPPTPEDEDDGCDVVLLALLLVLALLPAIASIMGS